MTLDEEIKKFRKHMKTTVSIREHRRNELQKFCRLVDYYQQFGIGFEEAYKLAKGNYNNVLKGGKRK
jgi:hypothetical protein